tara:strand:+ start:125 stop:310 length:186 start_codon:yes stop_codon:yes gene_type:complete
MFKKLKKDYEDFISSRSEVRLLEGRVKLLQELNNALFITASRVTSSYVDNVLTKEKTKNNV